MDGIGILDGIGGRGREGKWGVGEGSEERDGKGEKLKFRRFCVDM